MSTHRSPARAAGELAGLAVRSIGRRRTNTSPQHVLASARAVMAARPYCTFITTGPHGPTARVVEPRGPDTDLTLWVGTSPTSRKAREARASGSALLAYDSHRWRAGVVARCSTDVVADPALLRRWFLPTWRAFWPAGPADDDFVLIRCLPFELEVWDLRRGVTPEPFGLTAARIARRGDAWVSALR